ncbi:MAG: nucleoside monophosphate kinase [Clostridia bacterium]|nr:nucleoside monophosphate kinase [Clostridia bacterium]
MFIIILGAPGSGKGTVSKLLSEMVDVKHISTGDMFRQEISKDNRTGRLVNRYISKGLLVPDEIVNNIIVEIINNNEKGLILDGYPRTINQAKFLEKVLHEKHRQIDKVFNLDINDQEIIYRTEKRRICSNTECGEIYNLEFKKPLEFNTCDKCGEALFHRDDDKKRIIQNRLELYHKRSKEIVSYYENKGLLTNIKLNLNENITKKELKKYLK